MTPVDILHNNNSGTGTGLLTMFICMSNSHLQCIMLPSMLSTTLSHLIFRLDSLFSISGPRGEWLGQYLAQSNLTIFFCFPSLECPWFPHARLPLKSSPLPQVVLLPTQALDALDEIYSIKSRLRAGFGTCCTFLSQKTRCTICSCHMAFFLVS